MPLQATSGAASYDAFGGGVPVVPAYIEEVFSTYLYTGNGSTQTITNDIDLSTKGGLVWVKTRTTNTGGGTYNNSNILADSARTPSNILRTNGIEAQDGSPSFSSFNSNGFTLGTSANTNNTGVNSVSWTFRKQPKFFDVLTYTGNGANRTIAHNLGSVPGCYIVKRTSSAEEWFVYHRSTGNTAYLKLNDTDGSQTQFNAWNNTTPTDTVFSLSSRAEVNQSGSTYVAYLFAHDAGGFGLTGTDNVISCGSFTTDGTGAATVNLGYEAQWVLIKRSDGASDWTLVDTMRGMSQTSVEGLQPNTSNASSTATGNYFYPTATGFNIGSGYSYNSTPHIYIAIRRGPMKVPTSGTSVFTPVTYTGDSSATRLVNAGVSIDMNISAKQSGPDFFVQSRLIGVPYLRTRSVNAEDSSSGSFGIPTILTSENNKFGFIAGATNLANVNATGSNYVDWAFTRAPTFFDVVCYIGNGSTQTITHNLGVVPELIIGKNRTTAGNNWPVLFNFASTTMNYGFLNLTNSCPNDTYANVGVFSAAPTSTSMFLVNSGSMNTNTNQHIAYLFATCAGVSKVFSYTGNGSSQTINCGFTGGARFVLIKRTDSTGDWYVWDTARGIVSGNDSHLSLNSTAAEVTSDDTIDTDSTGFVVNQVSATDVNVSSATYIGLAIA